MTLLDKNATETLGSMINGAKRYASRGVAGTALGLGIAGTALSLFGRHGHGLNIFGNDDHCEHRMDGILAKENADVLMLTNQIWGNALREQNNRFNDIVSINQKIFDNYVYTNSELAGVKEDTNNKFFANYKETRDIKDHLVSEISELKTEVAVLKAVAPYQQQITNAAINASAQQSQINLMTRTQRMLEGILVPFNPTEVANPTTTTTNPSTGQ